MARCAELIYVAGPQAGQRAALMTNPVIGGRAAECDVHVVEECVSRKAFTLTLTRDGWIFENLTSRKMDVSGGKYKAGKKVLLETGDVIRPGLQTRLLFVSAQDDAEAALAAYREAQVPEEPEELPMEEEAPAEPGALKARPVAGAEASLGIGAEVAEKVSDQALRAEVQAKEKAAKRRKYLAVFLVYMLVLVGLAVLLKSVVPAKQRERQADVPPALTKRQIQIAVGEGYKEFLDRKKIEAMAPNAAKADECLRRAIGLWKNRDESLGNPYQAVRNFKLHLVYSDRPKPEKTQDEKDFDDASAHLVETVWKLHQDVLLLENGGKWRQAQQALEDLERVMAGCTDKDPESAILDNAKSHLQYVRSHLAKGKAKGF
jgi:hypothetical protein